MRSVRPVLAVSFTYALFSTFWVYVGVFAIRALGAHPGQVGVLFLLSAPPAAVANYASGALSDRVGRRGLIAGSFIASAANMTLLWLLVSHQTAAFALIVLQGVLGAPAYALDRALVADLVPEPERREGGYAAVRVAGNLGQLIGPPLAALLIRFGGWAAFLLGLVIVAVAGAVVTVVAFPARAHHSPLEHRPAGAVRRLIRDRPFALLLISTLLGFTVYVGYETVLPVIAVSSYHVAPSTWGLLLVIAPLSVVIAQLRLTRATAGVDARFRLAGAMLLMGLPFLALIADAGVGAIAAVIAVFVLGDMLWTPTYQALAAELAPPALRGSYFGALAAMTGPAWTLVPLVALELHAGFGPAAVWGFFALAGVLGAGIGARAGVSRGPRARSARRRGWRSGRSG